MQTYRASNSVPFLGFLLLFIVGAVSAVGAGLALFAAEYYLSIYLILLFPILAGCIVGGALVLAVRTGKVRSPFFAGFVGLLAALLMFGVYHFASYYIGFRGEARAAFIENTGKTPNDAQLDTELNFLLEAEVGTGGFPGYLQLVAQEGFSITRALRSSESGIDLTGNLVYAYWVIEILIGAVFAVHLPRKAAGEPFDEASGSRYGAPTLIGIAPGSAHKPLALALEKGDFQAAGRMLTTHDLKYPRVELMMRRSPVQTGLPQDVYLILNWVQRKGRRSANKSGIVSPTELDWIRRGMEQANEVERPGTPQPARQPANPAPSERFEF